MHNDILENLLSILNEYSKVNVTENNYQELDLLDDCGYNSIQTIELICSIEDVFSITLSDEFLVFDNIRKISSIVEYIEKSLS